MENIFSLEGKNALVIGGAGGIGEQIAIGLAKTGANVAIASRKREHLEKAAEEIGQFTSEKVRVYIADVDDEASIQKLVEDTVNDYKHIDILVNATGFATKSKVLDITTDLWDSMFRTNVRGILYTSQAFGRHMKEIGGGKILNLSSVRGFIANAGGNGTYCSTKGAVNMLTKTLACEFAEFNVNVNAIAPSLVATETTKDYLAQKAPGVITSTPLGRLGMAAEMAGAAVFLVSPAADFITGQILCVDGGLTARG